MLVSKPGRQLVWLLLALATLLAPRAAAQSGDPKVEGALFAKRVGDEIRVVIELEIADDFHIYHRDGELGHPDAAAYPTTVTLSGEGFTFEPVVFPTPHRAEQEGLDTWVWEHTGSAVFHARGAGPATAELAGIRAVVDGQVCDPNGCESFEVALEVEEPPKTRDVFAGWDAALARASAAAPAIVGARGDEGGADGGNDHIADAGANAVAGAPAPAPQQQPLGAFLLAAFFGGLFALLMPCTYPMIPITISFFTKQADTRGKSSLGLSAIYGIGIVLCFVVIGLLFRTAIIPFANHALTNLFFGLAFIVFAISLFGAFELRPPRFLLDAAGSASRAGGLFGVFFMGVTLSVTSFTCTAPFVGSLLAVGAAGGVTRVALGMTVFGATMATPFVLLSLLPGKARQIPRAGDWMHTIKVFLGFLELAAALKFVSNVDVQWQWLVLPRELFLFLWFAIFACAALYLLGVIRMTGETGEVSPWRMVAGVGTLLFAIYCGFGALGHQLDRTMTAFLPDYSSSSTLVGKAGGEKKSHLIVVDDLEAARKAAIAANKIVLINFTGHV